MTETGQALLAAAGQLLAPGNAAQLDFEGDADEFGQYLCETMAAYGASHLHLIGSPEKKIIFLQQVNFHSPPMLIIDNFMQALLAAVGVLLLIIFLDPGQAGGIAHCFTRKYVASHCCIRLSSTFALRRCWHSCSTPTCFWRPKR